MHRAVRAAVLYAVDDIRIEERPVPQIAEGELLVRTRACGICSGDVMEWYVKRKAPLVFGHEPAGVVAAVGPGEPPADDSGRAFAAGDRVFVHHHAPCFACTACSRGDFVQCERWRASAIDPGGMAEYFRVPRENVRDTLRLPDDVSFEDASLVEPLACVVKSLRRGAVRAGETLLVMGLGVMGQLHVLAALALGARVLASDFSETRRALAAKNGALALHPREVEEGADVVVCGPGTPEALGSALATVRPGGTVVMFTPFDPAARAAFDAERFYFKDLRLVASYSSGPNDTREALALVASGVVSAKSVGAQTFALEEAAAAHRALAQAQIVKPIVVF
ncbi:MAG: alcohol dehydrogenase catalytic domain-containing protein [Candidatus Tyrphobacter sp.]